MRVKVIVEGSQGSGKTTVASILRDALLRSGLSVILHDDGVDHPIARPLYAVRTPDVTIVTVDPDIK